MLIFEEVYEKYFSKIYNYMFYRLLNKELAEDLTSEFFMKILEKLYTFDEKKSSLNTWMFKIANNLIIDYFRCRKVNVSTDDEENPINLSIDFEGEAELIKDENRKELYRVLTGLDARSRKLISLKYFFEISNKEIAQMTGINESTVSTICLRAIEKLKKTYKK